MCQLWLHLRANFVELRYYASRQRALIAPVRQGRGPGRRTEALVAILALAKYQRTARAMTSSGKRYPQKADPDRSLSRLPHPVQR